MQISEGELSALTEDMEDLHRDTLPAMKESISEWTELNRQLRSGAERVRATATSRRTFLLAAGAVVGAGALAACSKSSSLTTAGTTGSGATPTSGAGQSLTGDLAVAALAASLENVAVAAYQAGLDAAGAGRLSVPSAVATFAKTAQQHHRDHAAAWNSILTGAGKQTVTGVDMTVNTAVVQPQFAAVKDVVGLAKLALELENVAAATYLSGIGVITDNGALKIAASIQPVEMQHAAILNLVLGSYPIPDSFAKTDGARSTSDQIG